MMQRSRNNLVFMALSFLFELHGAIDMTWQSRFIPPRFVVIFSIGGNDRIRDLAA